MAYLRLRDPEAPAGLGCGPGCTCCPERRGLSRLGQRYIRDDAEALGASITALDPRTQQACTAEERRITRIVEPPPADLVAVERRYLADASSPKQLQRAAYAAYLRLKAAAEADGITQNLLTITSGYRSVRRQEELWQSALQQYHSPAVARRWVAPPGHSPHHTGRAIDLWLGTRNSSGNIPALRATPAYQWLVCNASRFGFTPYAAEPWHWEYNPPGTARRSPRPSLTASASRPRPRPDVVPSVGRTAGRRPLISPTPAAAGMPPGLTPAEAKALRITTTFETGRPLNFSGLTGDFDGQGLSFGLLQWNFGTGSLQPMLLELDRGQPERFDAIFGADAGRLRDILRRSPAEQLQFARSINDERKRIVEPWATHFQRLGEDHGFQAIQLRHARSRIEVAARYARRFGLRSERALAFMFDTVTQNGAGWLQRPGSNRAMLIEQRRAVRQQQLGSPLGEREMLAVIAGVIADTVIPRWRDDVRRRRMTIVEGRGRVHGRDFDLEREFGLTDLPFDTAPATAPGRSPGP